MRDEKVRTRLLARGRLCVHVDDASSRRTNSRMNERTNVHTYVRALVCERARSVLRVYVRAPDPRRSRVIACEFRDVGCFLLPVVSVIRSSLFTNESPPPECNREFTRKTYRRPDTGISLYPAVLTPPLFFFFSSHFQQTRFLHIIVKVWREKGIPKILASSRFACRRCATRKRVLHAPPRIR